jgi:hypothetical protein
MACRAWRRLRVPSYRRPACRIHIFKHVNYFKYLWGDYPRLMLARRGGSPGWSRPLPDSRTPGLPDSRTPRLRGSPGWSRPRRRYPRGGPASLRRSLVGLSGSPVLLRWASIVVYAMFMRCLCDVYAQASPLRSYVSKSLPPGSIHNTQRDLSIFLCVVATHLSKVDKYE